MALSKDQRRFIFLDQGLSAGITIFIIVSLISRHYSIGIEPVPLWGDESIALQTFKTAFMLPLISCFLITMGVRKRIAKGKIEPLTGGPTIKPVEFLVKCSLPVRALILGITGVICIATPTILVFSWYGFTELTHDAWLWYKPAFIAMVGLTFLPISSWTAMVPRPSS